MNRTQIYLSQSQHDALGTLAKSRSTTASALIREAIDGYLASQLSPRQRGSPKLPRVTALLDASVLIDILRGRPGAVKLLQSLTEIPASSEICRVELLQGLRADEERDATELMAVIDWIPVVEPISVRAGELGRRWRPSHSGIGVADLIIAATAELTDSSRLTLNVTHFPMVEGLQAPY